MMKIFVIIILAVFCLHFIAIYAGLIEEPTEGGISSQVYQFIKKYVDIPIDWMEGFIDERKEAFEKELEREKKEIEEGVRETGRSLWSRIGIFIFGSD